MNTSRITIKQLRAFHAVVLSGCNRKNPKLAGAWASVAKLERAVGAKLFKRSGPCKRELSQAGVEALSSAIKILALVDFMESCGACKAVQEDAA